MHKTESSMEEKFKQLAELGAGDFSHLDGSLIDHLTGTRSLLKKWSASAVLQDAGLYHAAYGTAGFTQSLVSSNQRTKIASIIGMEAEEVVYLYCACDRDSFWSQFAVSDNPEYKDRFTGKVSTLTQHQLEQFCELTVANELEITSRNTAFISEHGKELYGLFNNMQQFISSHAKASVKSVLGDIDA